MKTSVLITRKASLYTLLLVFLSLLITSCGSYQNSSYYDNDGIYSTNEQKNGVKDNQSNGLQYQQYFASLQTNSDTSDIFTDVNNYSNNNYNNIENDSIQPPSTGYASWGSSPEQTTVTVYPDTSWYFGFGWGYPYYGYGWGYPYYGWGYPPYSGCPGWGYPGWGYPGYGYPIATPYAYNYSRRGSYYGGNYNRVTPYNRNSITNRNNINNRNSIYNNNTFRRNSFENRKAPTFTNRNSSSNYNTTSRNSSINQSRNNSNYTQNRNRTYNQSTQRSYTPSSNNSYRSSGAGMSGGRMSGGGGGGRMSGGGGRR